MATNLRYRGSMVSLYYSRQAIGIYRADGNIYSPPTRGYNFDTDFLSPPLLPPGTPMFRDINTLKFRQISAAEPIAKTTTRLEILGRM